MGRAGDNGEATAAPKAATPVAFAGPTATSPTPVRHPPGLVPAAAPSRRILRDEVWIVLGLTFLASAIWAVLDLVSRPTLAGTTAVLYQADASPPFHQIVAVALALVPVLLVVHLLHRSGEGPADIGLSLRPRSQLRRDLARGLALFALVGSAGLALYLGSVALGVNRDVAVIAGETSWWTVPVWLVRSVRYGLTEEVIVAGYLLHRLGQLGWSANRSLAVSALLRGTYHLYQGFGGFAGNLAMGLLFGRVYQRTGRTVPLIVAHVLVDAVAGIGYLALRDRVGWLAGS
ncbi:MAG TPA: CPBP family intramembrane glutamic endopeptidase [Acidimicrobiales bacterium]